MAKHLLSKSELRMCEYIGRRLEVDIGRCELNEWEITQTVLTDYVRIAYRSFKYVEMKRKDN